MNWHFCLLLAWAFLFSVGWWFSSPLPSWGFTDLHILCLTFPVYGLLRFYYMFVWDTFKAIGIIPVVTLKYCCSLSHVQLSWDPMDCNHPGSSVHGISQAGILTWVVISFSRVSSWPRDQTHVSCIGRQILTTELTGKPGDSGAAYNPFVLRLPSGWLCIWVAGLVLPLVPPVPFRYPLWVGFEVLLFSIFITLYVNYGITPQHTFSTVLLALETSALAGRWWMKWKQREQEENK